MVLWKRKEDKTETKTQDSVDEEESEEVPEGLTREEIEKETGEIDDQKKLFLLYLKWRNNLQNFSPDDLMRMKLDTEFAQFNTFAEESPVFESVVRRLRAMEKKLSVPVHEDNKFSWDENEGAQS